MFLVRSFLPLLFKSRKNNAETYKYTKTIYFSLSTIENATTELAKMTTLNIQSLVKMTN